MRLNDLRPKRGSRKKEKRIGRGPGSGHGKTSTKGHKGSLSRSGGGGKGPGFEGGQMPLIRRIPKRGFTSRSRMKKAVINLDRLSRMKGDDPLTVKAMKSGGIVRSAAEFVKVLGKGELTRPLTIHAHQFSQSALQKIERKGGKAEVIKKADKGKVLPGRAG